MTDNIITQVSQDDFNNIPQHYEDSQGIDYNSKIHLNIRGYNFTITRDELMSLPESILLCLFPNGVFLDADGQVISNLTEEDTVYVSFDPQCFKYIIDVFHEAHSDLERASNLSPQASVNKNFQNDALHVLNTKPSIIVLREDLDFYVVPPIPGLNEDNMRYLKIQVAQHLLKNNYVFSGLGYDINDPSSEQHLGPAEKHLFDMLCSSGFHPLSDWGNRSIEPSKCMLLSLLLVRLKNKEDETPPPDSPNLAPVQSNASARSRSRIASLASSASRAASRSLSRKRAESNTNNKLLLFWRKPARKCWWTYDTIEVDIKDDELFKNHPENKMKVKVHMRRVWTLELSVVGVQ